MRFVVIALVLLCSCKEPASIPSPETYRTESLALRIGDTMEQVPSARVNGSFFEQARAEPQVGRLFTADDFSQPGIAIISARLWRGRLGGNASILGSAIQLNGQDFVVVGILPESFAFPPDVEIWLPM